MGPRLSRSHSSHRGELSQDSVSDPMHRNGVSPKVFNDTASRRTRGMYHALSASSVGLELGVSVLIGLLGGMWLDGQLGSEPWAMLCGLVIGLIAGFRGVIRAVERSDNAAKAEELRG